MRRDPTIVVIGEDVAGGAGREKPEPEGWFAARGRGLIAEFGPERVIDTPIAEMGFVGAADASTGQLLWLAARHAALAPGREGVDKAGPGPIGRVELAASTVPEMRRRREAWIARLKREEEMGGSVPWPPGG